MRNLFRLALAASAAMIATPAFAEDRPEEVKGTLTLVGENDSLSSGADRNYTSGIKLTYISPVNVIPKWVRNLDGLTRAVTNARPSFFGVAVGQSIFTPQDISLNPAPANQHPYAGFLYAQILMAAEENVVARDPRFVDLYELEFGMVGPSAQGQEAQSSIHQLLGAPEPLGWESQLHDEFAFAVSLERRWRAEKVFERLPFDLEVDAAPGIGVTLGTLRTEAKVGAAFRLGQHLSDDYGPPRVRPGLSGVGYFKASQPFSWYFFGGVEFRAVARNLFLDGNTFRDSPSVERRPFVVDVQAGVAVQTGDWRLAYTYVTRTEEFEGQGEQQDFGALALSWRF
ncbi:MAG: lipid A deacylase LpxR family protein [Alphaproteobacteria bacterium]|nr:lipid A deacylase LpxR family protein [Alphaproteobacteria bacterium]